MLCNPCVAKRSTQSHNLLSSLQYVIIMYTKLTECLTRIVTKFRNGEFLGHLNVCSEIKLCSRSMDKFNLFELFVISMLQIDGTVIHCG